MKKKKSPRTAADRIVKALQIISVEFMVVMLVVCAVFIIKNDSYFIRRRQQKKRPTSVGLFSI